jgi:anti-sigma factor RsiW
MTASRCGRIAFTELTDYAAGELPDAAAAALEEHLFACADCGGRAAELDALVQGISAAARSAEIGGFITDAILNRLAREGVRVRTFAVDPGARVPCAVWDDDEVMVLRLRGDLGGAAEFSLTQTVAGREVSYVRGEAAVAQGEIVFATPAAWIRDLPAADVELRLVAHEAGAERPIASYTLVHGGTLHRR